MRLNDISAWLLLGLIYSTCLLLYSRIASNACFISVSREHHDEALRLPTILTSVEVATLKKKTEE